MAHGGPMQGMPLGDERMVGLTTGLGRFPVAAGLRRAAAAPVALLLASLLAAD